MAPSRSYGLKSTTNVHHVISDCILWLLTRVLERDYCIPARDYFSVKQLIMFREEAEETDKSTRPFFIVSIKAFDYPLYLHSPLRTSKMELFRVRMSDS